MREFIISDVDNVVFQDGEQYTLVPYVIDEEDFYAFTEGVGSYINSAAVSEMTGLEYNNYPAYARVGDILYIAKMYMDEIVYYMVKIEPLGYLYDKQIYSLEELDIYLKENVKISKKRREFVISDLGNVIFIPEEKYSFAPCTFVDKEDFDILSEDIPSYVSDEKVAEMTGRELNISPVYARVGDVLYYAQEFEKDKYAYHMIKIVPQYSVFCQGIFNVKDLEEYLREV